jgi:hypothetical protein
MKTIKIETKKVTALVGTFLTEEQNGIIKGRRYGDYLFNRQSIGIEKGDRYDGNLFERNG